MRYGVGSLGLIAAIEELSLARDLPGVQAVVRRAARELCGSDGATFVLRDGGSCFYADEDAMEPLWKGQRFPLEACISGWAMLHSQPAIVPDIYADPRIPHEAYRPTFVRSLVMVPMRRQDPIGAIGNYWAQEHRASAEEVVLLQALANATAVAMEFVAINAELEDRVARRTAELEEANAAVHQLSLTDELTGLHNRRGFELLAGQELAVLERHPDRVAAPVFLDVDGLKRVNDEEGHLAGDRALRQVAGVLAASCRHGDVLARLAGDEFVVFADVDRDGGPEALVAHLRAAFDAADGCAGGVSVGVVTAESGRPASLPELLAEADAAMYRDKRSRRGGVSSPVG